MFRSLALSELARPGLVDSWARAALGEPVPHLADGRPGVRYQWLGGDLRRAAHERRGGVVRDVVGSLLWSAGARHSIVGLRDPGPALRLATARLRPGGDAAPATVATGGTRPAASAGAGSETEDGADEPSARPDGSAPDQRRRSWESSDAATKRSGARWSARAS